MQILLTSESETLNLGKRIAANLSGGEMILLSGEMGAGKTLLTKGIAAGLGYSGDVNSPTFTLLNSYNGRLKLYHYDLFRLNSIDEAEEAGLTEFFFDSQGVCVIEWPDLIESSLQSGKIIRIDMKYIDEETRQANIEFDKGFTSGRDFL